MYVCVCVVCVCVCVCGVKGDILFHKCHLHCHVMFATTSRMMMMVGMTSHTDKFFRNHHDHTEEGGNY